MRALPQLFLAVLVLTGGCYGQIEPARARTVGVDGLPPPSVDPGPSPIRRLTRWEYDNTVRDLFGDVSRPATDFSAEEEALGFNNNAAALTTSPSLVDKYLTAGEAIAARLVANLARASWYSCSPTQQGEDACANRFIEGLGRRAFRRPLDDAELQKLKDIYNTGRTLTFIDGAGRQVNAFEAGLRLVVEAALNAPDFLYRVEVKSGTPTPEGLVALSDDEIAARLSYLLWGSMPDEQLFSAAEQGALHTGEQIASQVTRMLQDPKARGMVAEFHRQWLDYDRVKNVTKAADVYPAWNATLPDLMEAETSSFIESVVFTRTGTWDSLLSAPYTFVNPTLSTVYKVAASTQPANPAGFRPSVTSEERHVGLLSQGALMAFNAHTNQTSPVHRGKLIRETFLCQPLTPPPADAVITVPDPSGATTARERFAQHSASAACSGCHSLMDPIGFSFEKLDGMGLYRETESGKVIDDRGELVASDVNGTFTGVRGLANRLVASRRAQHCYVVQWFRFAFGRGDTEQDDGALGMLFDNFEKSGHNIRDLIVALTRTHTFRYRRAAEGQ